MNKRKVKEQKRKSSVKELEVQNFEDSQLFKMMNERNDQNDMFMFTERPDVEACHSMAHYSFLSHNSDSTGNATSGKSLQQKRAAEYTPSFNPFLQE